MSVDVFSLACNIMTVIDFGHKSYRAYKHVYENGKIDEDAQRYANQLSRSISDLQASRKASGASVSQDDQVMRAADQCLAAADALKRQLSRLEPSPATSRVRKHLQALRVTTIRMWRHDEIESLIKSLETCESMMKTEVLVGLHVSGDARELRYRNDFSRLEKRLQNFIDAVSMEQYRMSQLFDNRVLHHETQAVILHKITAVNEARISDAEISRFRSSLKFQGLNERFNNGITHVKENSYRWLLGKGPDSDSSKVNRPSDISHEDMHGKTRGDFSRWLQKDDQSKLYWISGKPGSGKSTLMKFLCKQLEDDSSLIPQDHIVLHHFFWLGQFNLRSRQNDTEGFYSTILHQLLGTDVGRNTSLADTLWSRSPHIRSKECHTDWSLEDLRSTLHAALQIVSDKTSIYILIDALDEHLPSTQHEEVLHALRDLQKIPNVRLVVSSRREAVFRKNLTHCRQLRLEHLTAPDIHRFAKESLQGLDQCNLSSDSPAKLLEELVRLIVGKADGVFLWARLAVESIKRGLNDDNTEDELLNRLHDMPAELSNYFKSIWKRLGDDERRYQTKAANIFSLLLSETWNLYKWPLHPSARMWYSRGPRDGVRPDLLTLALALSPTQARSLISGKQHIETKALLEMAERCRKMVLSHCAGLVEIVDTEENTVFDRCTVTSAMAPLDPGGECRFIHRTAREFFREDLDGKAILETNSLDQDGADARMMLAFLARSVAYREPGHDVRSCTRMRNLNIQLWLENATFGAAAGSNFTHEQRNSLMSLCDTVYHRFAGSLENPRFDGWQLVRSAYLIRPFVLEAAYYGHLDYVERCIDGQGRDGPSWSRAMRDAVMRASLVGQVMALTGSTDVPSSAALRRFLPSERLFPPSLQTQVAENGDFEKSLPYCCMPPVHDNIDPHQQAPMRTSCQLISTSRTLLGHIYSISQYVVEPKSDQPSTVSNFSRLALDVIIKYLGLLREHNALQSEVWAMTSIREPHVKTLHFKFLYTPGGETSTPPGAKLIFASSVIGALRWFHDIHVSYNGPTELTRHLGEFLRSAARDVPDIRPPRPVFLVTGIPKGSTDKLNLIPVTEVKTVPPDMSEYLWEPLLSNPSDPQARILQEQTLLRRCEEVANHPESQTLRGKEIDKAFVEHGMWCSIEERDRATAECRIRMPCEGAEPIDWSKPGDKPDRFMVPPEGASKEDVGFSYRMMLL